MKPISSIDDVYNIMNRLKREAMKNNQIALCQKIDDALALGSSGLEILGALRQVLYDYRKLAERLLGSSGRVQIYQVIQFIDKSFGRTTRIVER